MITGGALTVYDPTVAKCAPQRVSKGQSFIEPADHLHMARNEGTKPATLYAFYLGLPTGAQANRPGTAPTGSHPSSATRPAYAGLVDVLRLKRCSSPRHNRPRLARCSSRTPTAAVPANAITGHG